MPAAQMAKSYAYRVASKIVAATVSDIEPQMRGTDHDDHECGHEDGRPCICDPCSGKCYSLKFAPTLQALDAVAPNSPVKIDTTAMSASAVLTTTALDRENDVIDTAGIDTGDHEEYPISMLDHGVYYPLGIGLCRSPTGRYLVEKNVDAGEVWETTYFSQKSQVAVQAFALIDEGIMRGNSIGFDPLEVIQVLWPNGRKGKHVVKCRLVECCVAGDTRILTPDGYIQIRDLEKTSPIVMTEYGPKRSRAVISKGELQSRKITTTYGNEVVAADRHRFRVVSPDGTLEWRYAQDIHPGDYILAQNGDRGMVPEDRGSDPEFWFAVGAFYGDGSYIHDGESMRWAVRHGEEEILDRLIRFFKSEGYSERTDPRRGDRFSTCKEYRVEIQEPTSDEIRNGSVELKILHTSHVGLDAVIPPYQRDGAWRDAGVPAAVWSLGKKQIGAFLNGLFSTDGYVGFTSRKVGFTSTRPALSRDVQQLLRLLGILSHAKSRPISTNLGESISTVVNLFGNKSFARFAKRVGFTVVAKQIRAEEIAVPVGRLNEKNLGWPKSASMLRREFPRQVPGRPRGSGRDAVADSVQKIKVRGGLLTDRMMARVIARAELHGSAPEVRALFREYLNNDWYFEKVASNADAGTVEVFDPVAVEDTASYVSNGLVSHNTWTCLPVNREALAPLQAQIKSLLGKGRVAGEVMAPAIKSMLGHYSGVPAAGKRKSNSVVVGFSGKSGNAKGYMSLDLDEARGAVHRAIERFDELKRLDKNDPKSNYGYIEQGAYGSYHTAFDSIVKAMERAGMSAHGIQDLRSASADNAHELLYQIDKLKAAGLSGKSGKAISPAQSSVDSTTGGALMKPEGKSATIFDVNGQWFIFDHHNNVKYGPFESREAADKEMFRRGYKASTGAEGKKAGVGDKVVDQAGRTGVVDSQAGTPGAVIVRWDDGEKRHYNEELFERDGSGWKLMGDATKSGGARSAKAQPSDDISPAKAKQILKDGSIDGKPLTEDQKKMFGAAASKDKKAAGDDGLMGDGAVTPTESAPVDANMKPSDQDNQPLNAGITREFHGDLLSLLEQFTPILQTVDNPPIREKWEEVFASIRDAVDGLSDIFGGTYPDLDPLTKIDRKGLKPAPKAAKPKSAKGKKSGRAQGGKSDWNVFSSGEGKWIATDGNKTVKLPDGESDWNTFDSGTGWVAISSGGKQVVLKSGGPGDEKSAKAGGVWCVEVNGQVVFEDASEAEMRDAADQIQAAEPGSTVKVYQKSGASGKAGYDSMDNEYMQTLYQPGDEVQIRRQGINGVVERVEGDTVWVSDWDNPDAAPIKVQADDLDRRKSSVKAATDGGNGSTYGEYGSNDPEYGREHEHKSDDFDSFLDAVGGVLAGAGLGWLSGKLMDALVPDSVMNKVIDAFGSGKSPEEAAKVVEREAKSAMPGEMKAAEKAAGAGGQKRSSSSEGSDTPYGLEWVIPGGKNGRKWFSTEDERAAFATNLEEKEGDDIQFSFSDPRKSDTPSSSSSSPSPAGTADGKCDGSNNSAANGSVLAGLLGGGY